jgi:hypothetical protein
MDRGSDDNTSLMVTHRLRILAEQDTFQVLRGNITHIYYKIVAQGKNLGALTKLAIYYDFTSFLSEMVQLAL